MFGTGSDSSIVDTGSGMLIDIDEQNAGSKSLVIESDATALLTINDTSITSSVFIDTPDLETAIISARDGTLAMTIADSTGVSTFVSGTVLVAPVLGTPASGTMTNVTGTSGITGLGTQTQDLEMGGFNIQTAGVITLKEQADADADVAGELQLWSNTETPNTFWFTDDAGTDFEVASKTGTHAAIEAIGIACGDETTVTAVATGVVEFTMPYAFTLTEVRATVTTAPTTDAAFTVDVHEGGTTIFSTKITIDATQKTSTTAATPAVISDSSLADGAIMTVDVDAASAGATEAGLKIWLIGYQT
jgi:hypothetical protein